MKVFVNNRQEVNLDPQWIAEMFVACMLAARYMCEHRAHGSRVRSNDRHNEAANWVNKLDAWPLERVLRDWMTHPDGLNVSWEDEVQFGQIWSSAHEMLKEAGL